MPFPANLRRRHILQMLAGASGAALLHACGGGGDQRDSSDTPALSMTLGTIPWVGQVPMYIAQDKGFYEEEGLDFDLRLFGSGSEYIAAFIGGQLNGVSPVTSEAVVMKSQGKDFKIVMVQDNSVGGDGILARNDIQSIEDFKGKKVAVDTSGVSYFFLLQVLQEAGLTKNDITAVNTEPSAAAAAFQSNNIDIAVTYAPFLQAAAEATPDGRVIYDSAQMPTAISDLYVFDTQYVEENLEAVQAFVNGTLKGLQYLQDNEAEGIEISAAVMEMEPEDLASDLAGINLPDKETNLQMLAQPESDLYLGTSLKDLSAFLKGEEQIEAEPTDLESTLDPQFVEAASL